MLVRFILLFIFFTNILFASGGFPSVDDQISAYHATYAGIKDYDPDTTKIPGFTAIAENGIRFVESKFSDNPVITARCESLRKELESKKDEGLTAVEFVLFNLKLAMVQEYYPDEEYPMELHVDLKKLLTEGSWETTPFYESHEVYQTQDSPRSYKPVVVSVFEGFALKPYVIYVRKGGFKVSRIVSNLLSELEVNLCALPIGTMPVKSSPHGLYNRTPYDFLIHDLFHTRICHRNLSSPAQKFILGEIKKYGLEMADFSPLETFVFFMIHENGVYEFNPVSTPLTMKQLFDSAMAYLQRTLSFPVRTSDPFHEILASVFGVDDNYGGMSFSTPPTFDGTSYSGTATVSLMNDSRTTFTYRTQRTSAPYLRSELYECGRLLDIKHSAAAADSPMADGLIAKVEAAKGDKDYPILKEDLKLSFDISNINLILRSLEGTPEAAERRLNTFAADADGHRVFHTLAIELLERVRSLFPDA